MEKGEIIMGFKNNTYATIFQPRNSKTPIDIHEKYATAYVGIFKTNRLTNLKEKDFSGWIRFIGRAFERIKNIEVVDKMKIRLLEVEVTSKYNAETNKSTTVFICWDFDVKGNVKLANNNKVEVESADKQFDPLDDNSDLPF